jgi:hypothetical protein
VEDDPGGRRSVSHKDQQLEGTRALERVAVKPTDSWSMCVVVFFVVLIVDVGGLEGSAGFWVD